ncbi:unnamed protein product [Brassica rapa subsp. narinosa]
MATKKFPSLLLLSMMVFALIIFPIDSAFPGLYYKCTVDGCTLTPACSVKCKAMGFLRGGECRIYSYGGACCCECTDKSCINIAVSSPCPY